MPELPEVQTVADHIKPDLIGKNVTGIEPVWKKVLHNFAKNDLTGKHKIKNVSRRAKFIIIEFKDFLLAVHLRMTGKHYILDQDKTVRDIINQHSKYEYKLISFDLINL